MKAILFVLALFVACIFAEKNEELPSIHGMQALTVKCDTQSKLTLMQLYANKPGFDFTKLSAKLNATNKVLVSAEEAKNFKEFLKANEINYKVVIEDVSKEIRKIMRKSSSDRSKRDYPTDIFDSFPRYKEIDDYLKKIAREHNDIVEYITIGKSFEGRDISGVKISSGGANKPSILLDAGSHAREWIGPTTALYAIKLFAENLVNRKFFQNVDIYIFPLINPDGYEYSHKSEKNRIWRKTRSINQNSTCRGVDINRNFARKWGGVGASTDPCSEVYAGPGPFSEPETRALRDFILSKNNMKVYLSLHAAYNTIFYPWGSSRIPHFNTPTLSCVAKKAAASLTAFRGTEYQVGTAAEILYPASGGSDDWAIQDGYVELTFTIELPSRTFDIFAPVNEIKPIGQETFEAIKVFAKYAEVRDCSRL